MPSKSSQKKKGTKHPKYVIPPLTTVKTRSKSVVTGVEVGESATPTAESVPVVAVPASHDGSSTTSALSEEMKSMEARWDYRFSRMEDSMRQALCNKPPAATATPSPPVTEAPVVQASSSSRRRSPSRSSRRRSSSSARSSSSSSTVSSRFFYWS